MNRLKPLPQIISELLRFFTASGNGTSADIARRTGINQSQIHRNLFGKPKRVTETHRRLCIYAKLSIELEAADPRSNAILMEALESIWDGSDDHARRLARLLFAHNQAGMRK